MLCMCALIQERNLPAVSRKLEGRVHQRVNRLHCHHSLQQPHLPHRRHRVGQVTQRLLHHGGRLRDHVHGILQVYLGMCSVTEMDFSVVNTEGKPLNSHSLMDSLYCCALFNSIVSFLLASDCRKNYGITVKELDQPLLVHRPKERSKPRGKVRHVIPY